VSVAHSFTYLAFLAQHTPGEHRVMAVIDRGEDTELQALAGLPDASSATKLAGALNGLLGRQVTAHQRLTEVLDDAPDAARAAIEQLLPALAAAAAEDPWARRLIRHLPAPAGRGYLLFSTTNCPGNCEVCGTCGNDCADCEECSHGDCETCLPVTVTPRTAALLSQALAVLADEAYDHIYRTSVCSSGAPGPLGAVPACVSGQDQWFLRRYARAFDDLASDLHAGRLPLPTCAAEEIALDIAIRDAERIHHDEDELVDDLERDLPASRFDYDWDHLQDALFQDKDYEGLLYTRTPLPDSETEAWFEEFGNISPREPQRGFRR
jgi:hypothetical protein